jgi:dihydroxy-acid dehydratase
MVAEILGFALPGSALPPAGSARRLALAEATGRHVVEAVHTDRRPSALVTHAALHDAWRLVCAVGGSTNAIIHLQALAGRAGVEITMDELRRLSETTPTLARVRPNGPCTLEDLEHEGGVTAVVRELADLLHLDRPTAARLSWREVLRMTTRIEGPALCPRDKPVAPHGALAVLRGSLAPSGAVLKRSAATAHLLAHTGPAVVFDGLEDLRARIDEPDLPVTEDSVLILRGVGPVGGPGMPEAGAIPIPAKLYRAGVRDMVRISDARMSGTAAGTVVLHAAPEAAVGGPLALVRDGDLVALDVAAGRLDLLVEPDELRRRALAAGAAPRPGRTPGRGYRLLYARHVTQADRGCDFDFLTDPRTAAARPTTDSEPCAAEPLASEPPACEPLASEPLVELP